MAKKIRCKVILHGIRRQHDGGEFDSISAAKKWISESDWDRPYTIQRMRPKLDGES